MSDTTASEIPLTDVTPEEQVETVEEQAPATPAFAMFRTLVMTALLSGLLVVLVVQWATPHIEANQKAATEAAVFNVVKGATVSKPFFATENGLLPADQATGAGTMIYAGYDDAGSLIGIALPGVANGYAGPVHVMYAWQPEKQAITAYQVLTMTETPGLGDKVLTDENFLANFHNLDARLAEDNSGLANDIVTVKNGTKVNEWEIDAISGATVTSAAIGVAVNQSAQQWLPVIHSAMDMITDGGASK